MHEFAEPAQHPRIMINDLSPPIDPLDPLFIDPENEQMLLRETANTLYEKAELIFVELLRESGILRGSDDKATRKDYLERFHFIFSQFINGELQVKNILQNIDPTLSAEAEAFHSNLVADARINDLYDRCQARIMVYMTKTGVLANPIDYVDEDRRYSDLFRLLSTGKLTIDDIEKLSGEAEPDPSNGSYFHSNQGFNLFGCLMG